MAYGIISWRYLCGNRLKWSLHLHSNLEKLIIQLTIFWIISWIFEIKTLKKFEIFFNNPLVKIYDHHRFDSINIKHGTSEKREEGKNNKWRLSKCWAAKPADNLTAYLYNSKQNGFIDKLRFSRAVSMSWANSHQTIDEKITTNKKMFSLKKTRLNSDQFVYVYRRLE